MKNRTQLCFKGTVGKHAVRERERVPVNKCNPDMRKMLFFLRNVQMRATD